MQYWGHPYTKNVFTVYLKFEFNWMSYILSGNPTLNQEHWKPQLTSQRPLSLIN